MGFNAWLVRVLELAFCWSHAVSLRFLAFTVTLLNQVSRLLTSYLLDRPMRARSWLPGDLFTNTVTLPSLQI
ncbi:hypothetical protein F4860DRAFT_484991 [Xylaria cubensis]|nr:hypothetical protein F4860DRAFT_484991 [Xylaria cubensis]